MYKLDPNAAVKADTIGAYLNETGKYIGKFTRAEKLVSTNKGTDGIGFTFKADDGRECRFDIWTRKGNGETLTGLNQVNAIMACLKVREVTIITQPVRRWENNQEVIVDGQVFPELQNKPIGLLLRSEEYEKMQDGQLTGQTGWRMGLFAIFQADTEMMASEVLGKKTKPEQLAKVIGMLADKPLKQRRHPASSNNGGGNNGGSQPPESIQFDDDIPF
ncbi:MAG: hypothetical protein JO253_04710 [Alphaproteobacteria bacterium]|nr:hypothetical protein [Alphaproteobacteria bacterium]